MSSSNLVSITAIKEADYGVTPLAGNFQTARFTSESLSGTPQTAKSTEIHSDRTSSGQVQVGLDVGGDIQMELSADALLRDFIQAGMMQKTVTPAAPLTITQAAIVAIDRTITIPADEASTLAPGDMLVLSGFTQEKNNGVAFISSISVVVDDAVITVMKETIADETSITGKIIKASRISVGTDPVSFSICKNYEDLTDKSISYLGMLVNNFSLSMQYGSIAGSTFGFMGNGYETPDAPLTASRTITPAGTEQPLNASSDIGTVFIDGQVSDFCVQNLNIEVSNGLTPQQCMGRLTAREYALGTASVNVSGSAYLADASWGLLEKKISQQPVMIAYTAANQDGGIAVLVHGAQLTFPDASAGGMDQQVSLEFSGSAKNMDSGYLDIYFY